MHSCINRRIVFKTTIEFVNKGIYVLPVFKLWSHYSTMRFKSHLTGVLYSDSLLQYLTKVHYFAEVNTVLILKLHIDIDYIFMRTTDWILQFSNYFR